jgi:hypothetical protein
VVIRNCRIRNNGNGIFSHDGRHGSDLLIEGCEINGNGTVGSNLTHNLYIQSVRPIYRNNKLGRLRAGAGGGNLKDRSADVLIEGNTIEGGSRMIDLSGWQNETAERAAAPNANRAIVQHNTIINRNSDAVTLLYTEGRALACDFNHNTLVIRRDQSNSYYVRIIRGEYDSGAVFAAGGNLLDALPQNAGQVKPECRVFDSFGTLNLSANWSRAAVSNYTGPLNTINGWATWAIAGVAPGFVDEANGDYSLVSGAAAEGYGK